MSGKPNVIFVVLDTVRRDRVSGYGYEYETTPHFDSFLAGSTCFTDAVAQAPWSIPSHASMFTGKYPVEHGATTIRPILRDGPNLPELLSNAGYETYAVSPNKYVRPATGFGRGFDEFETLSGMTVPQSVTDLSAPIINTITSTSWLRRPVEQLFNATQNGSPSPAIGPEDGERPSDGLVERVDSMLRGADSPFFLFANFMDAHLPRSPDREFFDEFVDDDLRDVPVVANEPILLATGTCPVGR